jgi:hypothetical protein
MNLRVLQVLVYHHKNNFSSNKTISFTLVKRVNHGKTGLAAKVIGGSRFAKHLLQKAPA